VYELIVIGTSWGGLDAVSRLLDGLSDDVHQPIVVAQHRSVQSERGGLERLLALHTRRLVSDPDDKTPLEHDHVYVAPPDYHVLVENGHLALSTDAPVAFARPSIDVLFESVADTYGHRAVAIVLTGANTDGARGLSLIKERGGVAIVQDPETSTRRTMPDAALRSTHADAVLPLEEIPLFLYGLCA
jgi:two-component system chemotaxis response regulator CheB